MNRNSKIKAKQTIKKTFAVGMAAILGLTPIAATNVFAAENKAGSVTKEETVYVTADASGQANKITVSDRLVNAASEKNLGDISELADIENVKGDETFTGTGTKMTWTTDGNDITYQGTSNKQLPVEVSFTYLLNGKEISPEDLAGKSGKLTIRINYKNNTAVKTKIGESTETLQSPFVMMTGLILPTDTFKNVEVDNGKIVDDGNRSIVLGFGMPGLADSLDLNGIKEDSEEAAKDSDDSSKVKSKLDSVNIPDSVEINADVTNFSMDSTFTIALTDVFEDLELDDIDSADDLQDAMDDLEEATLKLVDGTAELADGAKTLNDSYGEFDEAIATLKSGIDTAATGISSYTEGVSQLNSGAQQLSAGITTYTDGVSALSSGAANLSTGVSTYTSGVSTVQDGTATLQEQFGTAVTGAQALADGLNQLSAGIAATAEGTGSSTAGSDLAIALQNAGTATENAGTNLAAAAAALQNTEAPIVTVDTSAASAAMVTALINANYTEDEAAAIAYNVLSKVTVTPTDQMGTVTSSLSALGENLTTIGSNLSAAGTSATNIASSVSGISGSISTIQTSVDTLAAGATTLSEGLQSASEGIDSINTGLTTLTDNNETLNTGAAQLSTGAAALNENSTALINGASSLATGTATLDANSAALNTGAAQLSTGASTLQTASAQVKDGISQLSEGAATLADGTKEYKEEGIDTLTDALDKALGRITDVKDRLTALNSDAVMYRNYSGISDGMTGTVKFIISTEAIKAD